MSDVQTACPDLRTLCESVQTAQMNAARALLRDLASSVASANGILQGCPALRAGRAESYMRHIAYADPHGAFTIAYLVWRQAVQSRMATRPGAPTRFCRASCPKPTTAGTRRHPPPLLAAEPTRRPGDIVTATQGLHQIHRLGNASPDVAISLHIYGVDQADICSGVNHLIDKVLDASPRR